MTEKQSCAPLTEVTFVVNWLFRLHQFLFKSGVCPLLIQRMYPSVLVFLGSIQTCEIDPYLKRALGAYTYQ